MNWQYVNMSELEFVAIQFGVKFVVIYNLQHFVDKVCQHYVHLFTYFGNFVILQNYFMILFFFHFILFCFTLFSRSFYIIPYMDLRP